MVAPTRKYIVARDKTQRIEKVRTPREWWFKLRSFEQHAKNIPTMALFILRYMGWVGDGHCWIADKSKSGKLSPMAFNRGQLMILDAMLEQAFAGKPVRIIIPKSRRQGVSTLIMTLFMYLCIFMDKKKARLVAHQESSTKEIFDTVRMAYAKHLSDHKRKFINYSDLGKEEILFPDSKGIFINSTGMGRGKGRGGLTDFLAISELAQFEFKTSKDADAMDALLTTVTDGDPLTIVVIESTGKGSAGEFAKRVMAANRKKTEEEDDFTENPYKCVFLPWTIDPMCEAKKHPKDFDGFKRPALSGYELVLKNSYGATPSQIQWRRNKLAEKGNRDYGENTVSFAYEFPVCVEDALRTQSGRVYPMMNPEHPKMQALPMSYFSSYATHTRGFDWGSSESSPFVTLWFVFDPDKPAALVVDPSCVNLWEEFQNYVYDPITGDPIKAYDHGMDVCRYVITSLRPRGLVFVRKELFVRDFAGRNDPQALARRVHEESGYIHPSGDRNHPDLSMFTKGPGAFDYQTGVADRARKDLIMQFNVWKIPLMGYTAPHAKDTGKGLIHDGISMVQSLCAGNVIFEPEIIDPIYELARSAAKKLRSHRGFPTDEEYAAYEKLRDQALGVESDYSNYSSTGWREICAG